MAITTNLKDLGHDGSCDGHLERAYCGADAVAAALSATQPDGWATGAPAASIAFLCAEHLADEPLAELEHAEHNARAAEGPSRDLWQALLDTYPQPIYLAS
ncbi:hypothetical protein ACFYUV_04100 [Nonomuraea sp. NPDC003560]|uniref:hypothetical protein n=1 Tax=Nonomuraea sp. NPDC003560 TaxID=3364341 RepID=UPI003695B4B6